MTTTGRVSRVRRSRRRIAAVFLAPALLILAVLVLYPIGYTVWLSFHGADGSGFVGLANYAELATSSDTRRAILNNTIWVIVAPSVVTVLGLLFAVLTQRVRLVTAFKVALFMPMAISFLAAGVTFRLVYDEDPDRGLLNAALVAAHDSFRATSPYPGGTVRAESGLTVADGAVVTGPVQPGDPVRLPLVGLTTEQVPAEAVAATAPQPGPELRGVVWRDFTPGGGGTPGIVDPDEPGLPGIVVQALRHGEVVAESVTDPGGGFVFADLVAGEYTLRLPAENFTEPFRGVTWLGPDLVTPSIIGSYIWVWAGFAMVVLSAGLAAIPREAAEAARVDGASEWQIFRLVTVPLLRPVVAIVAVTLVINVLKVFDLVLVLAPESTQPEATVLGLELYHASFTELNTGLGSGLAVLLFLLVLPGMIWRARVLKRQERR